MKTKFTIVSTTAAAAVALIGPIGGTLANGIWFI